MNLFLIADKTNDCWVFDHEHQNTVSEPLCNGTEIVIDWYYKLMKNKTPKPGDKLGFYLSTNKFDDAITKIKLIETNEYGSTYKDELSGMKVWLCPWLQGYFGTVPECIYISCESINTISENELDDIMEYIYK